MASSAVPFSSTTMMIKSLIGRRATTVAATSRRGTATFHSTASAPARAGSPPQQQHSRIPTNTSVGTTTLFLAPTAAAGMTSRRPMSSSGGDGSSSSSSSSSGDRFSDDLEKLISRAGEKADRFSSKNAVAVAGRGGGEEGGALVSQEGEGEGEKKKEGSDLSARAMKFRAMISKLRPPKKIIPVKTFAPSREPLVDNLGRAYGLGRRKTSTARVWISMSTGEGGVFMVNSRPMIDYFPRDHLQNEILKPLEFTRKLGSFHVRCTTKGGGQAGQAGAIRLGLARALEAYDPWLRKILKKEGLMERDSRMVERKKPGLKKARKAPQWVKR
ncbi:unnamed protein product [Pylaiella littoralis]